MASSGEGSDRAVSLVPCTGALGFLFKLVEVLDNVSGIDTTFQRNEAGVFNRSTQHLLILLEEEVCDGGDCTDMVHAAAEG